MSNGVGGVSRLVEHLKHLKERKNRNVSAAVIRAGVKEPYVHGQIGAVFFGQLSSDDSPLGLVRTKAECTFGLRLLCSSSHALRVKLILFEKQTDHLLQLQSCT